ncbi:MAG: molybdenum cofactor biosynthesis protein MoaE [Proteobacteria bacterium]|nr:molybdenum cofactor biosynthesis protein MoaE [Pseudomonadota bacterium]
MFTISNEKINDIKLKQQTLDSSAGGFVCFEGWVRNHNQGKDVIKLAYEAYDKLAINEGNQIITEAVKKYTLKKALCTHRVGALEIGDMAIWVGVSAAHRDDAFKACRYILDEVKSRVPIYKNESWSDGESGWVEQEEAL